MKVMVESDGELVLSRKGSKVKTESTGLEQDLATLDLEAVNGDEKKEDDEEEVSDPLRHFGILVPQALRTAQSGFEAAVEFMVQIVLVQRKLEALEGRILHQRIRIGKEN